MKVLNQMIKDLDNYSEQLYQFLCECYIKPKDKKLSTLLSHLDEIVAIKRNRKYYGVTTKNGIITAINKIDGIVEQKELPKDLLRGYYRYNDGKVEVDEKLKRKIWEG